MHIDFGFMLSNSPGGVSFEAAPFKLTRELLQVMDSDSDGRASELFDYFKVPPHPPPTPPHTHTHTIIPWIAPCSDSGCFRKIGG